MPLCVPHELIRLREREKAKRDKVQGKIGTLLQNALDEQRDRLTADENQQFLEYRDELLAQNGRLDAIETVTKMLTESV